jgi:adenylate kinase
MVRVIGVFGLSGVGKSWLISRFVSANPVAHVQASQLLREAKAAISGSVTTSEALRIGAVLDNQALLVRAFSAKIADAVQPIIFDGHCVVDNGSQLLEIPVEVIAALSVSGLIFVQSQPAAIVEQRLKDITRTRPARSVEEIEFHQNRAMSVCAEYAKHLRLDLHVVHAGDEGSFASVVASILTIRQPRLQNVSGGLDTNN